MGDNRTASLSLTGWCVWQNNAIYLKSFKIRVSLSEPFLYLKVEGGMPIQTPETCWEDVRPYINMLNRYL